MRKGKYRSVKRSFIVLILLLLGSCQEKNEPLAPNADFECLMGRGLDAWKNVVTREDYENLQFFKTIYEKNIAFLELPANTPKIPKILHFIWVGPKDFPRESVCNVRSWVGKHPDWTIYFWTDRERPLPHPSMQRRFVQEHVWEKLSDCYDCSDNFAEKSDLLRYEILYQQGGVYVDHDVKCLEAFDDLNATYDLYCGLEVPFNTPLSSSVFPTNNLIGVRPGHPVLANCITLIEKRWQDVEREYPGTHRDAVINRVAHRTFSAFGESFKLHANETGNRDIIFPAYYFNAPKESMAIYARHEYKGTWFENESAFEKGTRERLMYLSKKSNKILLACSLMTALNLIGFACIFLYIRKRRA